MVVDKEISAAKASNLISMALAIGGASYHQERSAAKQMDSLLKNARDAIQEGAITILKKSFIDQKYDGPPLSDSWLRRKKYDEQTDYGARFVGLWSGWLFNKLESWSNIVENDAGVSVSYGVRSKDTRPGKPTLNAVQNMAYLHFGTARQPPRNFMTTRWIKEEMLKMVKDEVMKALKSVV